MQITCNITAGTYLGKDWAGTRLDVSSALSLALSRFDRDAAAGFMGGREERSGRGLTA